MFTDESLIVHDSSKQKLWVPKGTEVPPTQKDRWQDSVLVWGAIGSNGKFILEIVYGTMDYTIYLEILKRVIII